ncbi:hypothetical protein SLA2020_298730 [Shorea laevis]
MLNGNGYLLVEWYKGKLLIRFPCLKCSEDGLGLRIFLKQRLAGSSGGHPRLCWSSYSLCFFWYEILGIVSRISFKTELGYHHKAIKYLGLD